MDNKLYCVQCKDFVPFEVRAEVEAYPVLGVPTEIEAQVSYCLCCGSQLLNEELDNENLKRALEKGRVSPSPPLSSPNTIKMGDLKI